MKVCVISWGSRGDCTPMIVIARELSRRGHQVRLLVNDSKDKFASRTEFPDKMNLSGDFDEEVDNDLFLHWMKSDNMAEFFRCFNLIQAKLFPQHALEIMEASQGMDMLVASPIVCAIVHGVGEKLRIPYVEVALQPLLKNSKEPFWAISTTPFYFNFLNSLAWDLLSRMSHTGTTVPLTNPWRASLGLPPIEARWNGGSYLLETCPMPIICAYSSELSPLPSSVRDAAPGAVAADYPFSLQDEQQVESQFQPSRQLLAFLEEEPKPIYIGWGSMSSGDPRMASELCLRGLRLSGQRAVLHSGNAGVSVANLDQTLPDYDQVRAYAERNSIEVDYVPHSWLLPRCAAAVHHGGSGTTHATLRAGVPAIITPFAFDQPYWQYRCHAMGVGPRAPRFWDITPEQLGELIRSTLRHPSMSQRAAQVGARMRAQPDGATQAAAVVERAAADTEVWARYYDAGGLTGAAAAASRGGVLGLKSTGGVVALGMVCVAAVCVAYVRQ